MGHRFRVWKSLLGLGCRVMEERPSLFNLVDPPLRDGFRMLASETDSTFLVIRYVVTDPAVMLIHCHLNQHQVGGMTAVLLEGIDQLPLIPLEYMNVGL